MRDGRTGGGHRETAARRERATHAQIGSASERAYHPERAHATHGRAVDRDALHDDRPARRDGQRRCTAVRDGRGDAVHRERAAHPERAHATHGATHRERTARGDTSSARERAGHPQRAHAAYRVRLEDDALHRHSRRCFDRDDAGAAHCE